MKPGVIFRWETGAWASCPSGFNLSSLFPTSGLPILGASPKQHMENDKQESQGWVDLGAWVGRQQAFGAIANKCSAAQAQSLKHMKEVGTHEQLGISWDEFCDRHLGISRRTAERIISQYEEFGENYFRLSSLAQVAPDAYRALAPSVADNCVEIEGEKVALIPENAGRIRDFLRAQKRLERPSKPQAPTVSEIGLRLQHLTLDAQHCAAARLSPNDREQLQRHIGAAVRDWLDIGHHLDCRS
jgi:hypothetical protein